MRARDTPRRPLGRGPRLRREPPDGRGARWALLRARHQVHASARRPRPSRVAQDGADRGAPGPRASLRGGQGRDLGRAHSYHLGGIPPADPPQRSAPVHHCPGARLRGWQGALLRHRVPVAWVPRRCPGRPAWGASVRSRSAAGFPTPLPPTRPVHHGHTRCVPRRARPAAAGGARGAGDAAAATDGVWTPPMSVARHPRCGSGARRARAPPGSLPSCRTAEREEHRPPVLGLQDPLSGSVPWALGHGIPLR